MNRDCDCERDNVFASSNGNCVKCCTRISPFAKKVTCGFRVCNRNDVRVNIDIDFINACGDVIKCVKECKTCRCGVAAKTICIPCGAEALRLTMCVDGEVSPCSKICPIVSFC